MLEIVNKTLDLCKDTTNDFYDMISALASDKILGQIYRDLLDIKRRDKLDVSIGEIELRKKMEVLTITLDVTLSINSNFFKKIFFHFYIYYFKELFIIKLKKRP